MIEMPDVPIARAEILITRDQRITRSRYGGESQSIDYGATPAFSLTFVPMLESQALALEAWLESPDTFMMPPPGYAFPSGLGTARINGAGQAGTAINTDGWNGSTTVLTRGQWIQIGNALHRLSADAATNASGAVTLNLTRPLRTPTVNNQVLDYGSPQGLFRIADAERRASKVPLFTTVTVTVEAVL
ncbi:MAG: hypothetical protein AAF862_18050 [Pseudomonadota bacterium]